MEPIQTIGKKLAGGEQRDAVHFAIAPVIAHERLKPGQHVCFPVEGNTERVGIERSNSKPVGIVDPFLPADVMAGERCWLFMYPHTITGLRHEWAHPAFDGDKAKSEKWLREFAEDIFYSGYHGPDFDAYTILLQAADEGDFCLNSQPDWLYEEGAQQKQEMWRHLEVVRGRPFSFGHKSGASFRCSC